MNQIDETMEKIKKKQEKLREEVLEKRKDVYSDTYNFSVGEIINMYKDSELDLEPAYQRLFRWSNTQQSKFIESLLLGYPIPAIFTYQKSDGVWEVVDGVQRISSLLRFAGVLGDDALSLKNLDILEQLNGNYYNNEIFKKKENIESSDKSWLDRATLIDLKRSKLPIIVLNNRSHEESKYELFKRLNSGGSHLTPQEIRNALILIKNEDSYNLMNEFVEKDKFKTIFRINDSDIKLGRNMEYLTRYLIIANHDIIGDFKPKERLESFLDNSIQKIIEERKVLLDEQLNKFEKIIELLGDILDEEYAFRKYSKEKEKFYGGFSWFIYETILYGLLSIGDFEGKQEEIKTKILNITWESQQGIRVPERLLVKSKELGERELNLD